MTILRFPIAAGLIACVALLAASLIPAKASEVTYSVVNVTADDVLNVRDRVGVPGSRIVGILPPGTGGIVWTGPQGRSGDGGLWYHISHPRIPGTGGWVNARFLREEERSYPVPPDKGPLEPQGSLFKDHTAHLHLYRVIGVAANDVLNIRSDAGVSYPIVGMFPPHATDLRITGRIRTLNSGAVWVEVRSTTLPGRVGWVNGRYLDRM